MTLGTLETARKVLLCLCLHVSRCPHTAGAQETVQEPARDRAVSAGGGDGALPEAAPRRKA